MPSHDHAPGLWCDECPDAEEKRAAIERGLTVQELRERDAYWRRTDPRSVSWPAALSGDAE